MDWCIVNWRSATGDETFDVFEHECHYNKPRWNIWQYIPICIGILNALLK